MAYEKTKLKLTIADIKFAIECFKNDNFYKQAASYATDFDEPDFCVSITVADGEFDLPDGKKLTDKQVGNWYLTDDGKYIF